MSVGVHREGNIAGRLAAASALRSRLSGWVELF